MTNMRYVMDVIELQLQQMMMMPMIPDNGTARIMRMAIMVQNVKR